MEVSGFVHNLISAFNTTGIGMHRIDVACAAVIAVSNCRDMAELAVLMSESRPEGFLHQLATNLVVAGKVVIGVCQNASRHGGRTFVCRFAHGVCRIAVDCLHRVVCLLCSLRNRQAVVLRHKVLYGSIGSGNRSHRRLEGAGHVTRIIAVRSVVAQAGTHSSIIQTSSALRRDVEASGALVTQVLLRESSGCAVCLLCHFLERGGKPFILVLGCRIPLCTVASCVSHAGSVLRGLAFRLFTLLRRTSDFLISCSGTGSKSGGSGLHRVGHSCAAFSGAIELGDSTTDAAPLTFLAVVLAKDGLGVVALTTAPRGRCGFRNSGNGSTGADGLIQQIAAGGNDVQTKLGKVCIQPLCNVASCKHKEALRY